MKLPQKDRAYCFEIVDLYSEVFEGNIFGGKFLPLFHGEGPTVQKDEGSENHQYPSHHLA